MRHATNAIVSHYASITHRYSTKLLGSQFGRTLLYLTTHEARLVAQHIGSNSSSGIAHESNEHIDHKYHRLKDYVLAVPATLSFSVSATLVRYSVWNHDHAALQRATAVTAPTAVDTQQLPGGCRDPSWADGSKHGLRHLQDCKTFWKLACGNCL